MPIIHSHTNRKRRYIDKCKTFNIYSTNVNQEYNFDIQIQTTLSNISIFVFYEESRTSSKYVYNLSNCYICKRIKTSFVVEIIQSLKGFDITIFKWKQIVLFIATYFQETGKANRVCPKCTICIVFCKYNWRYFYCFQCICYVTSYHYVL